MSRLKKADIFILAAFFILNFILKFIFIDYYPLSYDESVSLKNTLLDFGHIKHEAEWDNNPPFYYYCLWVWHSIVPLTVEWSRMLSLLFVTIAICLHYTVIKQNINRITAIFVSLFLIGSYFITYYSQEARAYSLVLLLAVLSTFLFFKYLSNSSYRTLVFLSLLNFLLIYTHYITALLIFCQFIFLLLRFKQVLIKTLVGHVIIVGGLVLLRFTKKQFQNIVGFNKEGDFWLQKADLSTLLDSLSELYFFAPLLILFLILTLVFFSKSSEKINNFAFYSLLVGTVPTLILFLIGTQKSVFLSRYLIFTIPFLITFIIYTLNNISITGKIVSAGLIVFSFGSFSLKPMKGQDYRMVAEVIKINFQKGDYVFVNTTDNLNLFQYYFDYEGFLSKNRDSSLAVNRIYGISDTNQLKEFDFQNTTRVYLVQSFHKKDKGRNLIQEHLKKSFKGSNQRQFLGTELTTYQK